MFHLSMYALRDYCRSLAILMISSWLIPTMVNRMVMITSKYFWYITINGLSLKSESTYYLILKILNCCFFHFSVIPERKSFRAYTSILYLDPRMKIYIQVCIYCFYPSFVYTNAARNMVSFLVLL